MPYEAEISRSNPSCFIFLLDQSGSMADSFGGDPGAGLSKAQKVADSLNRLLQSLVLRCARTEEVRDYFYVAVIGYGASVGSALKGSLAGRDLVPISQIADNPLRVEDRVKKEDDGAGGLVDRKIQLPVWVEPTANNGTPMTQAFAKAKVLVQDWISAHSNSFPPVVVNLSDGEPTDGDPSSTVDSIRQMSCADGTTLVFNLHCSSSTASRIMFPDSDIGLPDQFAKALFSMSSVLPMRAKEYAVTSYGLNVGEVPRGFVFNADIEAIIMALDIGTRAANLR
ncbi:VWA domain-containing protein [candidate division KSB1 bacterium]|nr:MAG: VWA domain-containing protein [candidate division KSB1 bacterium]